MWSLATIQLCHCRLKGAIDNKETSGRGCVPINYVIFHIYKVFLFFESFQLFKNVKIILHSWPVQK